MSGSDPETRGEDTIAQGTALALAARVAGGAFTAVLTVFLARELGSSGYGVFGLALSVEYLLLVISDLGITQALQRFVAENRDDPPAVSEYISGALVIRLCMGILTGVVLVALAHKIAELYGVPRLAWALRAIAISLGGMNVLSMCIGVFTALRRQSLSLASSVLESAVELSASVVLVLVAGGAVAAAFGRAIGYVVGALGALALTVQLLRPARIHLTWRIRGFRRLAGDAGALLVVDGAYSVYTQIDSLLIGSFLSVGAVGVWQAPLRLSLLLVYPGQAIASAVAPRLVRTARHRPDAESFGHSVRLLVLMMTAATVVTTVWATPAVALLLGSSYRGSAAVLRGLAPEIFLSGIGPLVSIGMNYLGAARRRIPIAIGSLLVNLVIDLILIPRIGVLGGAIGTDVAVLIYVPAHLRFCQRALGAPLRPTLVTLARSAVAGSAMALVLIAFGTGRLGVFELVVGGAAGLVTYVAALIAIRELTVQELALARSGASSFLARRRRVRAERRARVK